MISLFFFFFNVEGIDLIKDFNLDDVPRSKYRHYPMICISLHLVDEWKTSSMINYILEQQIHFKISLVGVWQHKLILLKPFRVIIH